MGRQAVAAARPGGPSPVKGRAAGHNDIWLRDRPTSRAARAPRATPAPPDIAWSYEQPYREAELVRDRLAFDGGTVEETVGSTP